jgi:hypothetical protein
VFAFSQTFRSSAARMDRVRSHRGVSVETASRLTARRGEGCGDAASANAADGPHLGHIQPRPGPVGDGVSKLVRAGPAPDSRVLLHSIR